MSVRKNSSVRNLLIGLHIWLAVTFLSVAAMGAETFEEGVSQMLLSSTAYNAGQDKVAEVCRQRKKNKLVPEPV